MKPQRRILLSNLGESPIRKAETYTVNFDNRQHLDTYVSLRIMEAASPSSNGDALLSLPAGCLHRNAGVVRNGPHRIPRQGVAGKLSGLLRIWGKPHAWVVAENSSKDLWKGQRIGKAPAQCGSPPQCAKASRSKQDCGKEGE